MTRRALIFRHMKEDTGGLYPALLRALGFEVAIHDWQDGEAPAPATLAASDMIVAWSLTRGTKVQSTKA